MEWEKLYKFIEDFNNHARMENPYEDAEFFDIWELEMAKALLCDYPKGAIRISKIILASKDIGDINIKIE